MNLLDFKIIPAGGLDQLKFGINENIVKLILGEPENQESIDEEGFVNTLIWHYPALGLSLFFEIPDVLTSIEITNVDTNLWDTQIFDLSPDSIKKLFRDHDYSEFEEELHEWGELRISFEKLLMDFYFLDDVLVSVNFGRMN